MKIFENNTYSEVSSTLIYPSSHVSQTLKPQYLQPSKIIDVWKEKEVSTVQQDIF